MLLPKWTFLLLFAIAFLVMVVQISYVFQVLSARRNIFGANRRGLKIGIISHIGYSIVSLLLGVYFLFLYINSPLERAAFIAAIIALLVVLIIEAAFKKKA